MKRYMVFGGKKGYSQGGMDDLIMDTEVKADAIIEADKKTISRGHWAHVWDCEARLIVYTG